MPEGQDILVIVQPPCGTELTSFRMLGDFRLASTKVSRTSTRPRRPQQGGMLKHAKTIKAPSMFMASRTPGLMFNYRASFSIIFPHIPADSFQILNLTAVQAVNLQRTRRRWLKSPCLEQVRLQLRRLWHESCRSSSARVSAPFSWYLLKLRRFSGAAGVVFVDGRVDGSVQARRRGFKHGVAM